jgi:hypothetical protein
MQLRCQPAGVCRPVERRARGVAHSAKSVTFVRAAAAPAGGGYIVSARTTVRPVCSFQYVMSWWPKMAPACPQFVPQGSWTRSMPRP